MTGNVLIGGGTGFIGASLVALLRSKGYNVTVVSRMPGPQRISWNDLAKNGLPADTKAVINVAGQNVLNPARRWTPGFKQNVWSSRVNTTQSLSEAIIQAKVKPSVYVTISGVGIYKPSDTKEYKEITPVQSFDFLSKLCHEWEAAAQLPTETGVRVVTVRSGVVLGKQGGMIKQLYVPFYLGLGGPIGSGTQFLPWIHIEDLTNMFLFAIEEKQVTGVLNGVAPEVITNKKFTDTLAKAMWRPAFIPLPEFVLNIAFSEERAKIMTEGQKVLPERTLSYGFKYKYPDIESACKEVAN